MSCNKSQKCFFIVQGVPKKEGNPLLAAILKYFLDVINLSVYILFGKFRLFYVSGEDIVGKDARMSLCYAYLNTFDEISPCPRIWVLADCHYS